MANYWVLAVFFLGLWAWAVGVSLVARRWAEALGWAICGIMGAALFGGEADGWPRWLKLAFVAVFLAISMLLGWRRMKRNQAEA